MMIAVLFTILIYASAWPCLGSYEVSSYLRTVAEALGGQAPDLESPQDGVLLAQVEESNSALSMGSSALPMMCVIALVAIAGFFMLHRWSNDEKKAEGSKEELTVRVYVRDILHLMRVAWPLILGNTLEWYEYGIYGYTAKQMEKNFFQGSAIATWLGYAITFVARPFGGLVLGWVADNWGRSISVQLSLVGMLFGTVGQGCLPGHYWGRSFETLGVVILVFLRALQGLSAGGEIGAISSYMVESAPVHTLGWSTMLISFGGALGFALAATVCEGLSRALSPDEMLRWGWRVPFVISIFPGIIALAGRNNIPETEAFLEETEASNDDAGEEKESAFYELLRHRYVSLLIGGGATIGIGTMWYVGPIWTVSGLLEPSLGPSTSLRIASLSQYSAMVLAPIFGILTDVKGIAWISLAGSSFIALSALPVWIALALNPDNVYYAAFGIIGMWGLAQGVAGSTIYLFVVELFPTRLRTIGMGMSYNLAVSYFGGLGPALCEVLMKVAPTYGPGIWMSSCGCVSVASVLWGISLRSRGALRVTHIRDEPYFGAQYGADGEILFKKAEPEKEAKS